MRVERPVRWLRARAVPARRRSEHDHRALAQYIRTALPCDAACIDVGAHTGEILETIVEACPDGRHLAVEPIPVLAEDLVRRFPRVEVFAGAVGAAAGTARLHVPDAEPSRASLILEHRHATTEVDVVIDRLDALAADRHVAFIKVDVEGAERLVMEGATEIIRRCRPTVAMEFGRSQHVFGTTAGMMFDLMTGLGLRQVKDMDGRRLGRADFDRAWRSGRRWNFLWSA